MTYYVTFEVQTTKALNADQQERLREKMLEALDQAILPYRADVVTAAVTKE